MPLLNIWTLYENMPFIKTVFMCSENVQILISLSEWIEQISTLLSCLMMHVIRLLQIKIKFFTCVLKYLIDK